MLPSTAVRVIFWFNLAVCIAAVALGIAQDHGIGYQFEEGRLTTYLSCGELLLTAVLAWMTMLERIRQSGWAGAGTPWLLWFILSAAFVYFALDDALRIHESIGRTIHDTFDIGDFGLSDRFDDAVLGLYGAVGIAVLFFFRRELSRVRSTRPYWARGFVFTVLQVVVDVLGDRERLPGILFSHPAYLREVVDAVEVAQGVMKIIAESFFLSAFYCALLVVRQQGRQERLARLSGPMAAAGKSPSRR